MFGRVFITEETKIFKRAILWVEIGILSGLVILYQASMSISTPPADIVQRQVVWPMALVILLRQFATNSLFAGFMAITLTSTVMAQEYAWRILNLLLSRGIPRFTVIVAKFSAVLLPVLLIVVIPFIAGGIISGYFTIQFNGELDLSLVNFPQLGLSLLYGTYALLPYVALTLLFGVIGRSTGMALGGGIGFLILEMITRQFLMSLGQVGVWVAKWFPLSLSMSMLRPSQEIANVIPQGTAGTDLWRTLQLPSLPVASIGIALYIGLCLVFAGWLFSKQDLTG